MSKIKNTPRYIALELLVKIRKQKTYSNLGLNQAIQKNQLSQKDASLLTTLVYGVLQHRLTLEYWLKPFIKNPKKVDLWVNELLILSLYQMEYLNKVPTHAIFNEAIEIAKVKGHAGTRKFVTGILHAIKRKGLANFEDLQENEKLSVKYSVPTWIIQNLEESVGTQKTFSILESINQKPHDSLRVNSAKLNSIELTSLLQQEGIEVQPSEIALNGLVAQKGHLAGTKAFENGDFIIQDESAMLAAESMDIQSGQIVLDACAAPGGKTTQIAADLKGLGKVYALDIHEHKVQLIKDNAQRLGVSAVLKAQALDARNVGQVFEAKTFDQILVDAPCSGIGLMRRKPEVKYEKTFADSQKLAQIQLAILNAVAPILKCNGKLTYSTCTILNTENQSVINQFLAQHPEFEQVKTKTPKNVKEKRKELGLTIYPDDFDTDGFFIATLVKK